MALLQERIYTLEDIYALPDGQRAELINGRIYMMAPPNRNHQKISAYMQKSIITSKRKMGIVKFMLPHLPFF